MKKTLTILVAVIATIPFAYAQNTFPVPAGNVGIGEPNPGNSLSFKDVVSDSGTSGITWYSPDPLNYGISKTPGSWSGPNYTQLAMRWMTGIILNPGTAAPKSYVEIMGNGLRVTSGNVGIGTTSPNVPFQVARAGVNVTGDLTLLSTFTDPTGIKGISLGYNQASQAGIIYSENNTGVGSPLEFWTYNGSSFAPRMVFTQAGKLGIGTLSPDAALTVSGTIHSSEVKVNTNIPVPDYVFEPAYQLPRLSELKTYLYANHHLPEIPSAAELTKNGLNLSEMNLKLLKKVEELTLYIIDQSHLLTEQQKINQSLQKQINQLAKQLKN